MKEEFQLGLIGWPLKHSLSPAIHLAALKTLGLQGDYRCYPIEPLPAGDKALRKVLDQIRGGSLQGLNVTLPYKEVIIDRLERLTATAARLGAVNTVYMEGTELVGDNTDKQGFLFDLENSLAPEIGSALVLGAGGAARAVVSGLNDSGWAVWVAARRLSQAKNLVEALGNDGKAFLKPILLESDVVGEIASGMTLIVNATPVGMAPDRDASSWPRGIPFPERACLYDLVYTPIRTQIVRVAEASGLKAVNGMGMLVEQAALSFERWTNRSAPREAMWRAGRQAALGVE